MVRRLATAAIAECVRLAFDDAVRRAVGVSRPAFTRMQLAGELTLTARLNNSGYSSWAIEDTDANDAITSAYCQSELTGRPSRSVTSLDVLIRNSPVVEL